MVGLGVPGIYIYIYSFATVTGKGDIPYIIAWLPSLKLTAFLVPENQWLEDDPFLLGVCLFSEAMFVFQGVFAVIYIGTSHEFTNMTGWKNNHE